MILTRRFAYYSFLWFAGPLTLGAAGPQPPDAAQPYSAHRQNPITYDAELLVTVTAPIGTKLLRVWMPIPPSDRGQELLSSAWSTFPDSVPAQIHSEKVFGNTFAYFEFSNPQGAQVVRHQLRLRVWELRWNLLANRVQPMTRWPESFDPYRRSEQQAVVADARFEELLREIIPGRRNPASDLADIMAWTNRNFTYDHARASLKASSLHALDQRSGHCSDYHGFCAAMGRLLNQPTRITYGIHAFPKSSPSHCKLEVFLPPYGWVSFDVSETQKLSQALRENSQLSVSEREQLLEANWHRLTSGFRDNTWFLQTRGSDYELAPPAGSRVAVVRTIYAEADGQPLPDPDPLNREQTQFAWVTSPKFQADVPATYPFTNQESLREWRVGADSVQVPKSGETP